MQYEKLLLRMVICGCLAQPSIVSAGAVTVPQAVRATAVEAAEAAQAVLYKESAKKERADSQSYVVQTENLLQETEIRIEQLKMNLKEKKTMLPDLEKNEKETATAYAMLKSQLEDARQASVAAWGEASGAVQQAEALETALAETAENFKSLPEEEKQSYSSPAPSVYIPKETDPLLLMEEEIRQHEAAQYGQTRSAVMEASQLEQQRAEAFAAMEAAQESVNRAYSRAGRLQRHAEELDKIVKVLETETEARMATMQAAYNIAAQMRQDIADAELIMQDSVTTEQSVRSEADRAKLYYNEVIAAQENPPPYRYASSGFKMYSWNSQNDSGYQIVNPFTINYFKKKGEYSDSVGLSFDYIISGTNFEGRKGRKQGLSDTSLYLNRSRELEKYLINYTLTVNIPTAQASLSASERRALMSEDLVQKSVFGEGWNFTPEFSVSRKIGKEDLWTAGVSYSWRGGYDPTSDIFNDDLNPGAQWRKFLRWRHAGQSWQFVGELAHVATSIGRIANGTQYETGAEWLTRLTYRRVLPKRQDLVLYYWYDRESSTVAEAASVASPVHYFGAMWGKELDDKRKIRASLDMMVATGARYESLYNDFVKHRDKQTLGIGYDLKLSETRKLSFDAQVFRMKDGRRTNGDEGRRYKGWNVFITYGGTF